MEERIQKIIAKVGITSRRKAEELIIEGLVTVNGKRAVIGMKADLGKDHIKVNGKLIGAAEGKVYMAFNKPAGVLTAMSDVEGRPTVGDFLKRIRKQVFPVGRLDYNSEGLLLLSNDGDFANTVLHPKNKIPKTYRVKVDGFPDEKDIATLENGIRLDDGMTAPAKIRIVKEMKANTWLDIIIHEGRKRQVRRMFERVGHSVIRLMRIKISSLRLGSLKAGEYRYLTNDELDKLKKEIGLR